MTNEEKCAICNAEGVKHITILITDENEMEDNDMGTAWFCMIHFIKIIQAAMSNGLGFPVTVTQESDEHE